MPSVPALRATSSDPCRIIEAAIKGSVGLFFQEGLKWVTNFLPFASTWWLCFRTRVSELSVEQCIIWHSNFYSFKGPLILIVLFRIVSTTFAFFKDEGFHCTTMLELPADLWWYFAAYLTFSFSTWPSIFYIFPCSTLLTFHDTLLRYVVGLSSLGKSNFIKILMKCFWALGSDISWCFFDILWLFGFIYSLFVC